jgi:molybdenum cofactor synthesis domain
MNHTAIYERLQHVKFRIGVVTLSDRASQGIYEDKSGMLIQEILTSFFKENGLDITFEYRIIPDDKEMLHTTLTGLIADSCQYIFTTGSTGIGPRDIAPDVIKSIIEKEIPGIMEYIRVKYGAIIPNALLSRSIAGVAEQTIIYALPGSPKAVKEYLDEILRILLHSYLMLTAVDVH